MKEGAINTVVNNIGDPLSLTMKVFFVLPSRMQAVLVTVNPRQI